MTGSDAAERERPETDFDPAELAERPDYFERLDDLRNRCPVAHSDRQGGFWLLSSYNQVVKAGQDWQTFTSTHGSGFPPFEGYRILPISVDPPLQRAFRKTFNSQLTAERVAKYESGMRQVARGLIDGFAADGACDLAQRYNRVYPPTVFFSVVVDVGAEHVATVRPLTHRFSYGHGDDRTAAFGELENWCRNLMEQRRTEPRRDDVFDALIHDEVDGFPLTDEDRVRAMLLMIQGGFGTSANLLGTITRELCARSELQERVRDDRSLVPKLVEECLRYETPNPYMARQTTRTIEVDGHRIPPGEWVLLMFGAANRDEDVFGDPLRIDLDREVNRHLSFGVGVHRCIGSNLARLQVRVAVEELLDRVANLRLQEGAETVYYGAQTRGVASLPVTFDDLG